MHGRWSENKEDTNACACNCTKKAESEDRRVYSFHVRTPGVYTRNASTRGYTHKDRFAIYIYIYIYMYRQRYICVCILLVCEYVDGKARIHAGLDLMYTHPRDIHINMLLVFWRGVFLVLLLLRTMRTHKRNARRILTGVIGRKLSSQRKDYARTKSVCQACRAEGFHTQDLRTYPCHSCTVTLG